MKVILLDGLVIFHVNNFFLQNLCVFAFPEPSPKKGYCSWLQMVGCDNMQCFVSFGHFSYVLV